MTRLLIEHHGGNCPECGSSRIRRATTGTDKCFCYDCNAEWRCVPPDEEPKEKRKPGKGELRVGGGGH